MTSESGRRWLSIMAMDKGGRRWP
ncbi:uncharacterized protein G2W53_016179 [Senna tora]|uniref:Uncharacterized protein n=1 Tax=Senna tora TaxID=362788 RepID=A0A835C6P6_9FABA|nr:uncharacterized protein G2W53_016179 [Senna tora]